MGMLVVVNTMPGCPPGTVYWRSVFDSGCVKAKREALDPLMAHGTKRAMVSSKHVLVETEDGTDYIIPHVRCVETKCSKTTCWKVPCWGRNEMFGRTQPWTTGNW